LTEETMALQQQFETAAEGVKKLSRRPDNESLLALYSLFKQATEGDVSGSRPGLLDLKGRAKYDAWAKRKGLAKDKAMQEYVALVKKLESSQ
jgi:diazepam-binding inhibitor (GABA receptor modulator, acyl-CoA-binding protein)